MLTFLLALVLAALTGWLIEAVSKGSLDRAVTAFRDLIGGWRPDAWPRGVQEEDRDRPWGETQSGPEQASPAVPTTRLAAHVRGR